MVRDFGRAKALGQLRRQVSLGVPSSQGSGHLKGQVTSWVRSAQGSGQLRGQDSSEVRSAQESGQSRGQVSSGVRSAQESGRPGAQAVLVARPQGSGQLRDLGRWGPGQERTWTNTGNRSPMTKGTWSFSGSGEI